MQEYKKQLVGI